MKTNYQKVTTFNQVMGLAEPDGAVGTSSLGQRTLRHNLIIEEAITERSEAEELYQVMDAHGDSLVVMYGEANDYKFDSDIVFAIVNYANMTKVCKSAEEAQDSVLAYARGTHPDKMGVVMETHWDLVVVDNQDYFIVYNSVTGKGLKSINFAPPEPTLQAYARVLVGNVCSPTTLRDLLTSKGDAALIAAIHTLDKSLTNG